MSHCKKGAFSSVARRTRDAGNRHGSCLPWKEEVNKSLLSEGLLAS